MNNVAVLPIWKKDSTPAEWFMELSAMALANPERFSRAVVAYEEKLSDTANLVRTQSFRVVSNTEVIGLLEVAKMEMWEWMKGR